MGEDPFGVERLWDIMWRSTLSYDRKGVAMHAMSGTDLALWDLIGNATGLPVYKLLGGAVRAQSPLLCHRERCRGLRQDGLQESQERAWPLPPAAGREGMRKNVELIKRTRESSARMARSCWIAGWGSDENYTLELVQMLAPYDCTG